MQLQKGWVSTANCVTMHPIRIKLRLKPEQKLSEKEWKVTIAGNEKIHTEEWVLYRAETMEVALKSFEPKEVQSVLIEDNS